MHKGRGRDLRYFFVLYAFILLGHPCSAGSCLCQSQKGMQHIGVPTRIKVQTIATSLEAFRQAQLRKAFRRPQGGAFRNISPPVRFHEWELCRNIAASLLNEGAKRNYFDRGQPSATSASYVDSFCRTYSTYVNISLRQHEKIKKDMFIEQQNKNLFF